MYLKFVYFCNTVYFVYIVYICIYLLYGCVKKIYICGKLNIMKEATRNVFILGRLGNFFFLCVP